MSPKQAAQLVDKSLAVLRKYESGETNPPLVVALKLQILYREQLAGIYGPLYQELTRDMRAREEALVSLRKRGAV